MTSAPDALEEFLPSMLRDTWEVFRKQALVFALAALVLLFLSAASAGVLAGPLFVGFIDMVRRARSGEALQVGDLFGRFDSFASGLIAMVLIVLAVAVGSLLVLPGLLAALFSGFTFHAIAYERLSAIDAIKHSLQVVRAHFLSVVVVFLLVSVAQTLGGSALFGVLLTAPLGMIAVTLTYERLTSEQPADLAQAAG